MAYEVGKIRKHYKGCYRITVNNDFFGQIKKNGHKWHAEYRSNDGGHIVQYAGIWNTKREAVEEVMFSVNRGHI